MRHIEATDKESAMKRINEWLINSYGQIRGVVVDADGATVTGISTSPVVKREGNIVTTQSGSRYELLEAMMPHMDQFILDKYFGGAADPLAAIDYQIANREGTEQ